MNHTIEGIEVDIDWEQEFIIDNHGSGDVEWAMSGEDQNGIKYYGNGSYQDDELIEVNYIEINN